MKPFQFQKFTINQRPEVFRVGTDGVLLGALASVESARNILEVGTGTGLISLMTAQRNKEAEITTIDFNELAADLAQENFAASPFVARLSALKQDFKTFTPNQKFDLIISNPPFFELNSSSKDVVARQQQELTFDDLISKSTSLLLETGRLSVIIPWSAVEEFSVIAERKGLFLLRKVQIFGIENAPAKRAILEFSKTGSELLKEETFVIEKAPRVYSDQYLKATADFHVFG